MSEQKNRFQIAEKWLSDGMPKLLDDDEIQIIITIREALALAQESVMPKWPDHQLTDDYK